MDSPLGRLNGRVSLWLARCAAIVVGLIALETFADVVGRYVFNHPFSFTLEFTELGMGLIVYFAVGLVTHTKEHVSVDFVLLRLPGGVRALVDLVINVIAFLYLAVVVWRLFLTTRDLYDTGDMTPVYFIHLWPFGLAVSVASLLFLTSTALHIANAFAQLRGKGGAVSGTAGESDG